MEILFTAWAVAFQMFTTLNNISIKLKLHFNSESDTYNILSLSPLGSITSRFSGNETRHERAAKIEPMSPFIHKIKFKDGGRTGLKQTSAINIQKRTPSWFISPDVKKETLLAGHRLDYQLLELLSRGGTKTRLERVSEIQSGRNHPCRIPPLPRVRNLSCSPIDSFVLDVVYTYQKNKSGRQAGYIFPKSATRYTTSSPSSA